MTEATSGHYLRGEIIHRSITNMAQLLWSAGRIKSVLCLRTIVRWNCWQYVISFVNVMLTRRTRPFKSWNGVEHKHLYLFKSEKEVPIRHTYAVGDLHHCSVMGLWLWMLIGLHSWTHLKNVRLWLVENVLLYIYTSVDNSMQDESTSSENTFLEMW